MTVVRVCGVPDFAELGARWRDLERRAAGSFFQSWTWMGCLAAERFPDPVLVEASEGGRVVALALFNRVRPNWVQGLIGPARLFLSESGDAELDCPYVEQNGVLAEAGREAELTALCLGTVVSDYDVILSGVEATVLAAVGRVAQVVVTDRTRTSPFVDLRRLRMAGEDYLAGRSANTRQQIRRSDRFFERVGPIMLQRAASVDVAQAMLDEMAALHQASWTARGQPGSFARPFFRRFHRELVARGVPNDAVMLLKICCDDTPVGILYNFLHQGRMSAYQSGFAYRPGKSQAKPGLSCHQRAIRFAMDLGIDVYDFLAGEDRYKRSLADASYQQVWAQAGCHRSVRLLLRRGMELFRRGRSSGA